MERIYDLPSYTTTELYLGEGVWQVVSPYNGAIFRVYEETNTVQPYNSIARDWLDRQNTEAEKPTIVPTRPKASWEEKGLLTKDDYWKYKLFPEQAIPDRAYAAFYLAHRI